MAKTVPAIAEALEKIRGHVMLCCFRLHRIRGDQYDIRRSIGVWKPEMERYMGLVKQIKEKSKERTALVKEKKELPIFRIVRSRELAAQIAELTEDLEELRSEKARLLEKISLEDSTAPAAFRKEIAALESSLKKLTVQEKKYSGELDEVIAQYEALKAQSADVDPVELYDVRHEIRPEYEKAAQEKFAEILGKQPTSNAVFNARYNTDKLLHEDDERFKVRKIAKQQKEKERRISGKRSPNQRSDWER